MNICAGDRLLLLCSTIALLLAVSVPSKGQDQGSASTARDTTRSPSRVEVDRAIDLATGYLVRACGPDGKFAYQVDLRTGKQNSSYDIIRHAGAMYALAMANHAQPDPKVAAPLLRAAKFMRENYMGPGPRPGMLTVWSQPLGENPEAYGSKPRERYAELGGIGLGLVALAAARQVDPQSVPLEELQALGRFVLFLQRDDGSFFHKYEEKNGPVNYWHSLYYPGEAALGLIALYEADHSREWLAAANKALTYLAKSRAALSTVPADHWALIATAKLLPYCDPRGCAISREELVRHAVQVCESIMRDQFVGSTNVGLDGAFDSTGRTAPAATRLEGLVAALDFLPKGSLHDRIESSTQRGIVFLVRSQVVSGRDAGGIPGSTLIRKFDSAEVRIDYVQHSLCAWLRWQQYTQ